MNKVVALGSAAMLAGQVLMGCGGESPTETKTPTLPGKTPITSYNTVPNGTFPNYWTNRDSNNNKGVKACHEGIPGNPDTDDRVVIDAEAGEFVSTSLFVINQGVWTIIAQGGDVLHNIGTLKTTELIKVRTIAREEIQKLGINPDDLAKAPAVIAGDMGGEIFFANRQNFVNELPNSVCQGVKQPATVTTTTTAPTTTTTLPTPACGAGSIPEASCNLGRDFVANADTDAEMECVRPSTGEVIQICPKVY